MKKILIIPHGFDPNIRTRGHELAKAMAKLSSVEVYCVQHAPPLLRATKFQRLGFLVHECFRPISSLSEPNSSLIRIRIPFLYLRLTRWTNWLISLHSSWHMRRVIRKIKPDVIINSSYFANKVPRSKNYTYIFDLIDDHLPKTHPGWYGRTVGEFALSQLRSANQIWTISNALVEKLRLHGFLDVVCVPNGASREAFDSISDTSERALREKLGIDGSIVVGFIGNHSDWSGVGLVKEIAEKCGNAYSFLIVGGGSEVEKFRLISPPNMIFTGPVPVQDIGTYFRAINIGILPFVKNDYTDNSLPLKIIEYGLAGKIVVSERLSELATISFPFVFFPRDRTPNEWLRTLDEVRKMSWNPQWNSFLQRYTWQRIAEEALSTIEKGTLSDRPSSPKMASL